MVPSLAEAAPRPSWPHGRAEGWRAVQRSLRCSAALLINCLYSCHSQGALSNKQSSGKETCLGDSFLCRDTVGMRRTPGRGQTEVYSEWLERLRKAIRSGLQESSGVLQPRPQSITQWAGGVKRGRGRESGLPTGCQGPGTLFLLQVSLPAEPCHGGSVSFQCSGQRQGDGEHPDVVHHGDLSGQAHSGRSPSGTTPKPISMRWHWVRDLSPARVKKEKGRDL